MWWVVWVSFAFLSLGRGDRGRPKGGYINELKILAILGKKKIYPTAEKINALVYGGWDIEAVKNDNMYWIWSQLKKDEYLEKKEIPFN